MDVRKLEWRFKDDTSKVPPQEPPVKIAFHGTKHSHVMYRFSMLEKIGGFEFTGFYEEVESIAEQLTQSFQMSSASTSLRHYTMRIQTSSLSTHWTLMFQNGLNSPSAIHLLSKDYSWRNPALIFLKIPMRLRKKFGARDLVWP
jgi:hypothetical protein